MLNTMHMNMRHDDIALRAKPGESLSLDEMRARLPTIFAAEPHSSRSKRYVYISTEDMLLALVAKDFLPVEARVSRTRDEGRRGYTKHMLRFRAKNDLGVSTERRVGDTTFEVLMRNAHDGTGSYQFLAGLLKLLCLNGLVVSDGTIGSVRVTHTGNRAQQVDAVIAGAERVLAQGPNVLATVRKWQNIELNAIEQDAFAKSAHVLRFGEGTDTPFAPPQLLHARRAQEIGHNDLWSVFNRVQENSVRGGLTAIGTTATGQQRRATTRQIKGIDQDVKLNKGLWRLAEEMATIKS